MFDPQYNIDKPANEEDYEDEDEDEDGFTGGARRPDVVEDDPIEGEINLKVDNLDDARFFSGPGSSIPTLVPECHFRI